MDVASILVLMLITADTSNTLIRDEEEKLVEVLFYVHRNRSLIRDGEPRTATSTFTQLLSSEGGKKRGGGGKASSSYCSVYSAQLQDVEG